MDSLNVIPIPRSKDPEYEMILFIYPVDKCGEDLQKGSPVEVSAKGTDLYELKCRMDELILSSLCGGKCFVEMRITKDGMYHDCDEQWVEVDLNEKKVSY